jgi:hypothetical protein
MNKYKCRGVILRKLDRIERKCDKILSEILIIRHNQSSDVDILIERMRHQASEMRRQCKTENKALKRMLGI